MEDNETLEQEESTEENLQTEEENAQEQESTVDQEPTGEEDDDDSVVVSIGDEEIPEDDDKEMPPWVKDLRKRHKEVVRKNYQLEQEISKGQAQNVQQTQALGPKPTLESCDYDTDLFEKKNDAWHAQKVNVEDQKRQQQKRQESINQQWQQDINRYNEKKSSLKVRDFEESEMTVVENLDELQQSLIVHGADNPAIVVYALGKNPKKAKELASIKDRTKFVFAVAKLEASLKVSNRKKVKNPPEKRISSTGSLSGTTDKKLEQLRQEAEKSGNYTKVSAYNREKRRA